MGFHRKRKRLRIATVVGIFIAYAFVLAGIMHMCALIGSQDAGGVRRVENPVNVNATGKEFQVVKTKDGYVLFAKEVDDVRPS